MKCKSDGKKEKVKKYELIQSMFERVLYKKERFSVMKCEKAKRVIVIQGNIIKC